jgi:biopolymer transport protein ExbB
MWKLFVAGGWVMWPILFCSIAAMAIAVERFLSLRAQVVMPDGVAELARKLARAPRLSEQDLAGLQGAAPLGRILAAGLAYREHDWEIIKQAIEDTGRHVVHDLSRYLNTLGTIAAVSPWLGLLGTVFGMIQIFGAISAAGVGDPMMMAGGISKALLTTAGGLLVAIPSLILYRYLRGRVDEIVVEMEQEAIALMNLLRAQQVMRSVGNEQAAA